MVKINQLEIENVKRVKAVKLEPSQNGLTIIGGKNGQGKTSVLDSIAWALGGDRFRPSAPARDGSVTPPSLKIALSNGLVVERSGKNSTLKVIDPMGNKGGQQLLNEFVEELALNLPKFMQASSREKADILLKIMGVGDKLHELETQEQQLYSSRHAIGQIADQKAKYAKELPFYDGVPKEVISPSELIRQQQEILAQNGENQRKRQKATALRQKVLEYTSLVDEYTEKLNKAIAELELAELSAKDLEDRSTANLENNIANIDAINVKIRSNMDRERAEIEAEEYRKKYDDLSERLEAVRKEKTGLLNSAPLPLPGLGVENGELTYNGYKWDGMSGAEQLKAATAIVRKLKPQCGFVLLDKLEQMDKDTLAEFGQWLDAEGLQAIATRVSTGDECSIIIEDGYGVPAVTPAPQIPYTRGIF